MEQKRLQYKPRWFCYLDLLGFSDRVRSGDIGVVISTYEDVVAKLRRGADPKKQFGISRSWFSDTFILFSRGDSEHEFALLELAGRQFFQQLILAKVPVRGAISHGELYSNVEKNIFVGQALIEAYEYGEKQNWLGLVLAPSVFRKLEGTSVDLRNRYNYRPAPTDGTITHPSPANVFAYAFTSGLVSGANPLLTAIRQMKRLAPEGQITKYERTERFIRQHSRERAREPAT